jgi:DNA polymerase-3 subunit delta'
VTQIPLFGHASLWQRFETAADRGTLPASLLLHGPAGVGKQRLALRLGQRILCAGPADGPRPCGACQNCRYAEAGTHPDLHWIFPRPRLKDGDADAAAVNADYSEAIAERVEAHGLYAPPAGTEGIYVATIRAVVQAAALAPAVARRKVFVIGDAERMVSQEGADQAANAFLKLLEEPPENTNIILTSSEPGALLPTIRSRSVAVRVPRLSDAEVGAFLDHEFVKARLAELSLPAARDERLRLAHGAPGLLLAQSAFGEALERAQRILDAAVSGDRATRAQVAFVQGSARARGSFADALDALTLLLDQRVRAAVGRSDASSAVNAARAADAVERAKERAAGNANPQLVTFTLLSELEATLR